MAELFYLATLGGAHCIGLGDDVGNFEEGKYFDAMVVNPWAEGSPFTVFEGDDMMAIFEKFLYLGDDRNIAMVYTDGKRRI